MKKKKGKKIKNKERKINKGKTWEDVGKEGNLYGIREVHNIDGVMAGSLEILQELIVQVQRQAEKRKRRSQCIHLLTGRWEDSALI